MSKPLGEAAQDALKHEVVTRLPRELRDKIYEYMWSSDDDARVTGAYVSILEKHKKGDPKPEAISKRLSGHRRQFSVENIEYLYTARLLFEIEAPYYDDLEDLLTRDVFDAGLAPCDFPLRGLKVVAELDSVHQSSKSGLEVLRKLKDALEILEGMERRKDFVFDIELFSGYQFGQSEDLMAFYHLLHVLAPVISVLQSLGVKIRIHEDRQEEKHNYWYYDEITFDFDANQIVGKTIEDWETHVAKVVTDTVSVVVQLWSLSSLESNTTI